MKTPVIQVDSTYGIDEDALIIDTLGAASVSVVDSEYVIDSGGLGGLASLYSKRFAPYKAGQVTSAVFGAKFDTPQATSTQLAGVFNETDAYCFAYDEEKFGILRRHSGKCVSGQLNITNTASGVETITLTLQGVAYNIPLTAAATTLTNTAWEIAEYCNANIFDWVFSVIDTATTPRVLFRSKLATLKSGAYSFSSTGTAVATFGYYETGANAIDDWIYQEDWNAPATKSAFDPQQCNLYKIEYDLSYGTVEFYIFDSRLEEYVKVHTVRFAGRSTVPLVRNPNFRLAWASLGGATSVKVKADGGGCFIDGVIDYGSSQRSLEIISTTSNVSRIIGTIFNLDNKQEQVNHVPIRLLFLDLALLSGNATTDPFAVIGLTKNNTYTGTALPAPEYVDDNKFIALDTAGRFYSSTTGLPLRGAAISHGTSRTVDLTSANIELQPGERLLITSLGVSAALMPAGTVIAVTIGYEELR